jgi:pimeloyl-ACP methyl ester carboxylesterase
MSNYVVVPGLMGTELIADLWVTTQKVWLSYPSIAATGTTLLALNAAGTGPAPGLPLSGWEIGEVFPEYYSALISQTAAQGPILVFGYDWRLSILVSGRLLANRIEASFPGGQVKIVAHSMGGLVARAAMAYLKADGHDDLVVKLVTLGTPHYGTYAPMAGFARFDGTYLRLLGLVSFLRAGNVIASAALVDPPIATFPSIYELMPSTAAGPLVPFPQLLAAIYSAASYLPFNPFVRQSRLDAAKVSQVWLATAGDPARTVCVMGTGVETIETVSNSLLIGTPAGYSYTAQGDGTVNQDCGLWQGAAALYQPGVPHWALPIDPGTLATVKMLLAG